MERMCAKMRVCGCAPVCESVPVHVCSAQAFWDSFLVFNGVRKVQLHISSLYVAGRQAMVGNGIVMLHEKDKSRPF